MIEEARFEQWKDGMVSAAFNAWLLGAGKGKSFERYLKEYGLTKPEKPLDETQKKIIAEKALTTAEKIRKADKKRTIKNA